MKALVFGVDGVRKHAIEHYLDLAGSGRVDQWRNAFTSIAEQHRIGAIKVAFDFR